MNLSNSWGSNLGFFKSGKNSFCKYAGHLLRCCAQINPQRIKDTPAVNLCSRLVSAPPICKSAGKAAHLLRRIMKSVRPCTLFMANFGKAEISLLFKPAASVPLLKMLDVQKVRLRFISARLLASAPPRIIKSLNDLMHFGIVYPCNMMR